MKLWPWTRKPKAEVWDGTHSQARSVENYTLVFGSGADDYITKWVWYCTCGMSNKYEYRKCFTEMEAIESFTDHQRLGR